MKSIFISGIPAAGKSYLARRIAKELEILHVDMDDVREEMSKDPELKKWVEFFYNKNEEAYWNNTDCETQWENLKKQSEAFWQRYQEKFSEIHSTGKVAIFESVNLLPHLMHQTDIRGVYLISESVEEIFERNKRDPRWGNTEELQRREAEAFVHCEGQKYREEAEKYGYKVFIDSNEAEKEIKQLLN